MNKLLLTSGDVAKICGVNFRTILRWAEKGLLKAHKLPGRGDTRVHVDDLLVFLKDNNMPIPESLQKQHKILIVDDDRPLAEAIQRVLKPKGFTTLIAENGFAAGAALGTYQPDLITLDLRMPGLDGFEVIKHIHQHLYPDVHAHLGKAPKILVISAGLEVDLQRAISLGADNAISKPFLNQVLIDEVNRLLR